MLANCTEQGICECTCLALGQSGEDGLLNLSGVLGQAHMSQHHNTAEKQRSWVGKGLASDIRGRTMDSLENGALVANVARRRQTKTADQSSAHIGQNITVQVGHDQDLVVVWDGVSGHLQAGVVEQFSVELDIGEVLSDFTGSVEEETVGHLHNGSLVDNANLLATDFLGVLESKSQNALGSLPRNELDALHNAINDDVLNSRVFTLGVLTDKDSVDIVVGGLVPSDRTARTEVGKEVECAAQGEVERDVALANGGLNRSGYRSNEEGLVVKSKRTARGPFKAT